MITMILLVFALVLFTIAALGVSTRFNLIAAGLAFLTAAFLFGQLVTVGR